MCCLNLPTLVVALVLPSTVCNNEKLKQTSSWLMQECTVSHLGVLVPMGVLEVISSDICGTP